MDQAMGDLQVRFLFFFHMVPRTCSGFWEPDAYHVVSSKQSQLEEYKRRWEIEAQARMGLEREVEMLKARAAQGTTTTTSTAASEENATTGQKRARVE